MTNGPIANLKSKKAQKTEPTLLEELKQPLRDIVSELKSNLAGELQKVRERGDSAKYLETAAKLLPLIVALNPQMSDFASANSMQEIGAKLLQSIGFSNPDEDSIQLAIEAQDSFIAALQRIHQCASAPESEAH